MRQRRISMIAICKCPVGGTQHVVCRYIEETGCGSCRSILAGESGSYAAEVAGEAVYPKLCAAYGALA